MEMDSVDQVLAAKLCVMDIDDDADTYDDHDDGDDEDDSVSFYSNFSAGELHGYFDDESGSDLDPDDPSYVGFDLDMTGELSHAYPLSDAYDDALYFENIDEEEEDDEEEDDEEARPWWSTHNTADLEALFGCKLAAHIRHHFVYGFQKKLLKPPPSWLTMHSPHIHVSAEEFTRMYPDISPNDFVRAMWVMRVHNVARVHGMVYFDSDDEHDCSDNDGKKKLNDPDCVAVLYGIPLIAARKVVRAALLVDDVIEIAALLGGKRPLGCFEGSTIPQQRKRMCV